MVNLYKVEESGCKVLCDFPRNGMEEHYGHWSKSYGPYTTEEEAKAKQKEIYKELAKKYHTSDTDYDVEIKKLTIPESELVIRDGEYFRFHTKDLKKI